MGQTTSNVVKKVSQWASGDGPSESLSDNLCLTKAQFNPFVYERESHKYRDADGDIAHEFYEQQRITYKTKDGRRKRSRVIMKKVPREQLTPMGLESLPHPAINVNYPYIICDASIIRGSGAS